MSTLDIALCAALRVMTERPAALVTDIDGTISPIVARPELAYVEPGIQRSLRQLATRLELVAVITAREESVARRMVAIDELTYVGNYALAASSELRWSGKEQALASVTPLLAGLPCVEVEDKKLGFALHYRRCEDDGVALQLRSLLQPVAARTGARLLPGKKVIELVPQDLPDKGSAIGSLIEAHGLRSLVYLGDDLSDIAVFQELARRRDEDGLGSLSIAVVDKETDEEVKQNADLQLAGVSEVEQFLQALYDSLIKEES